MIKLQWPFKIKKRQNALDINNGWQPFSPLGTSFPPSQAGRLSAVYRCIKLYESLISCARLKTKDDKPHYIIDLLRSPNNFMNKKNFWSILTNEFFLNGVFRSRIVFDNAGRVTALYPYRAQSCYGYSNKGESSDAQSIDTGGHFYKDFKGRVLMPDEIFPGP